MTKEDSQNLNKYTERIQWIGQNRGKLSFAVSLGIILFLDKLSFITFDSVMPYLAGIAIWAALWNKKELFQKKKLLSAALLCIVICIDLCVEGFLAVPVSPIAALQFLVMYGIIFLLVGGFAVHIPSEKYARILYAIGCIIFGFFSSAGNYTAFERIAMPEKPFVFFLLSLLSFLSWGMLFGGALNAFHFLASHISQRNTSPRPGSMLIRGGYFCAVCFAIFHTF